MTAQVSIESAIAALPGQKLLILSSLAGLGNFSVGEAISERTQSNFSVQHIPIDSFIPHDVKQKEVERHRFICTHCSWILDLYEFFDAPYLLKLWQARNSRTLINRIFASNSEFDADLILCTSHRALLWCALMKEEGLIKGRVFGVLCDYYFGKGWKWLPWKLIDGLFGAIPSEAIPTELRDRYTHIEFPVKKDFYFASPISTTSNRILLCGGGWGLGPIKRTLDEIIEINPTLQIHVACGDNEELKCELDNIAGVSAHLSLPSLRPLMAESSLVISKPGAVTIAEAVAMNRPLLLLEGVNGVEKRNAQYAFNNFNARPYSRDILNRLLMGH